MKVVGGDAVANDFCQDRRLSVLSELKVFQRENCCTLAEHHAGTVSIEGPAFLRRGGLKRIEPCEDQFRKSIITSGHYPLIAARSHTLERVTNSICARSTGVRNHLTGNRKPKNVLLRIDYGFLRRVIGNPCWGVSE